MAYQLVMQQRNGPQLVDLLNATNRRFSFLLNRPSEFSCELDASAPEATDDNLQAGTRELIAYRDGEPLETVFALNRIGINVDADQQRIELGFSGIASYFADALVYGRASAYTGTTIPWSWINAFQARTGGSYGITQGAQLGTPASRSRSVGQDASLLDEIITLSESGAGFDFAISTDRAYTEWHTRRGSDQGLILEYGVNVHSFEFEESTAPGELVNEVRVHGPPNSGRPRSASDATSRAVYGRREASLEFFSEFEGANVTAGQLQNYANAALNRSAPLIIPQVRLVETHPSVPFGSYWLGDTINFRARVAQVVTINAEYRIIGIHVDLDENDNETITLDLNAV
jgi:hypothetical protein